MNQDGGAEKLGFLEHARARNQIKDTFLKFGLDEDNTALIMRNLNDFACANLLKLNDQRPSRIHGKEDLSMFDEEIVGAIFFMEHPEMVEQYLEVTGKDVKKWQLILAVGALYSDSSKVTGEGEMAWLYDGFHFTNERVREKFAEWKSGNGKDHPTIESVMQMPWAEARKLHSELVEPDKRGEWGAHADRLEKYLAEKGWDLHKEHPSFHDVMTRAHLIALKDHWEELSSGMDPEIASQVWIVAFNHHLTRGFPPGDGSLWERTGTGVGNTPEKKSVMGSLLVQLSDAVTAAVARPARHNEPFLLNARKRMLSELPQSYSAGRLRWREAKLLRRWIEKLPPDDTRVMASNLDNILWRRHLGLGKSYFRFPNPSIAFKTSMGTAKTTVLD